jgi:hypothetical protein
VAADTLGHLLALGVTPANEQDRAQVGKLAQAVQAAVEEPVHLAFVDQGYTGQEPAAAAGQEDIHLKSLNIIRPNGDLCYCPGTRPVSIIGHPKKNFNAVQPSRSAAHRKPIVLQRSKPGHVNKYFSAKSTGLGPPSAYQPEPFAR